MKKIVAVIGFMALGAIGWAVFGDQITDKAENVKSGVQADIHNKAQEITNSLK